MLPRPVKILDSDSRCVINPEVGRFGLEAQNINMPLNWTDSQIWLIISA